MNFEQVADLIAAYEHNRAPKLAQELEAMNKRRADLERQMNGIAQAALHLRLLRQIRWGEEDGIPSFYFFVSAEDIYNPRPESVRDLQKQPRFMVERFIIPDACDDPAFARRLIAESKGTLGEAGLERALQRACDDCKKPSFAIGNVVTGKTDEVYAPSYICPWCPAWFPGIHHTRVTEIERHQMRTELPTRFDGRHFKATQ